MSSDRCSAVAEDVKDTAAVVRSIDLKTGFYFFILPFWLNLHCDDSRCISYSVLTLSVFHSYSFCIAD